MLNTDCFNQVSSRVILEAQKLAFKVKCVSTFKFSDSAKHQMHSVLLPVLPTELPSNHPLPPKREKYSRQAADNITNLFNHIANQFTGSGVIDVSPANLCSFNKFCLENIELSEPIVSGRFRNYSIKIANRISPSWKKVFSLTEALLNWASNQSAGPITSSSLANNILKAIITHEQLLAIHPFGDGNGRTARAAEFAILLNAGVPTFVAQQLSNHYNKTRGQYYDNLADCDVGVVNEEFILYALRGLNKTLTQAFDEASKTSKSYKRILYKAGFTVVELLIVVSILSILAAVVIPRMTNAIVDSKDAACKANVQQINSQIVYYHTKEGIWPESLEDITSDVNYFPKGSPECPFDKYYNYNSTIHQVEFHDDGDHDI